MAVREEATAGGSSGGSAARAAAVTFGWTEFKRALIDAAAAPYRRSGPFAYHFARGKLRGDPMFRAVLELGLLRGAARILDLGCGQGLLAAWLSSATQCFERGLWPPAWPAPPHPQRLSGIELNPRDVERARRALDAHFDVTQADLRNCALPSADTVVMLDVLHYLPASAQRELLKRVHGVLPQGGLLLLRVGDAGAGLRHRLTRWNDQLVVLLRAHRWVRLHCRRIGEWQELLRECGFESRLEATSTGTPVVNVLLVAHAI